MVIAHNLSLRYSRRESLILDNISVTFFAGRITLLLGKSGAGKTTLLRCIAGLEKAAQGTITIDRKKLSQLTPAQRAGQVGIVFQQYNLFPHLTVEENCMQPLMVIHGILEDHARTQAHDYLKLVDMEGFAHRYPAQLSGGQQQRVALARALCLEPQVLLLDEPTSALDPTNTQSLVLLLQRLAAEGLAIVISSHDMEFVRSILDQAYLIEKGKLVDKFDRLNTPLRSDSPINRFLMPKA